MIRAALLAVLVSCGGSQAVQLDAAVADTTPVAWEPPLGAHVSLDGATIAFRVASTRATRIELWIYDAPTGEPRDHVAMVHEATGDAWRADLPNDVAYYGFRVWGPNWPYDPAWTPGTTTGWIADVDADGNRMNPNKLVFDPYARELSHDPTTPDQSDYSVYGTSSANRAKDSGPVAPKGVVVAELPPAMGTRPARPISDEVIYEVNLRGFTMRDAIPCAGTYAGAATRAAYLADLGVTAIELMPIQETPNARNDVDPTTDAGDNYWGYSTLAYFAPDRRYACDPSPGGPTRELRAMVRAFHDRGVKVYVDVVYNHTAEGGGGSLLSLRGLDNAGYYQLDRAGTGFTNSNGVGADLATQKPLAAGLVIDSLHYWRDALGVDGFRFDLAPVLGNTCGPGCFHFDPAFPATIAHELAGADLIAEPWGVVAGSYEVGQFPAGWSEWDDRFRDTVRADQNQRGTVAITPGSLATRLSGSPDLYDRGGRLPSASINYLVSHDGFTLHDLYACNASNNAQAWPSGPSDGGTTDNRSWDHGGDAAKQREAARTGFALMMLAQGVPMMTGGDERLHGQHCNNNPYNLDSPTTWIDWSGDEPAFTTFARRLMKFRAAHPALRYAPWMATSQRSYRDGTGAVASGGYLGNSGNGVLGWLLDGVALGDPSPAIFVVYNRDVAATSATLPAPPTGTAWYRVADTGAWMETDANSAEPGAEYRMMQTHYDLGARSLALFVAR